MTVLACQVLSRRLRHAIANARSAQISRLCKRRNSLVPMRKGLVVAGAVCLKGLL